MTVSSADVAKLRKVTGAGMMDCKEALTATNGDFDEAIDFLRKKGQKVSSKRADRDATEGVIVAKIADDKKYGVLVEVCCETDFVAKNSDFIAFVNKIADAALQYRPDTIEALSQLPSGNVKVSDLVDEQLAKIGEKIAITSFRYISAELVVPYIHMGNKIGVLVALNKGGDEKLVLAGKDVAMQIAAMNPVAVDPSQISQDIVNHELSIAIEQVKQEGKPENMIEKIAQGKLQKFFKENTLLSQPFVKDATKSVEDFIKQTDKDLKVNAFIRIAITA